MINKAFHWSFSKIKILWSDSLYRNSFWLMAGSFAMAGIGFFYWLIAARLYTPEQIGLATTFLSVASLIYSLALLGFGVTLIRYLPSSKDKGKEISTAITIVIIAALLLGIIYLIGLPLLTPKLLFITASFPTMLVTIFFFPINSINGITDSVFTAYRKAHWVFVSNVTQSITKLIAVALLSTLGVWGIIGSNIIATIIAATLCLLLISYLFRVRLRPAIDKAMLGKVGQFAFGSYVSGLIGNLPSLLMPILITNRISPEQTAYFYIPNMITGLLLVVPSMVSRSYFTERSNNREGVSVKKPILFSYAILIPCFLILFFFGKYLLGFFGNNYASQGYTYLILSSFSILISVLNYFLITQLLLLHKLKKVVIISAVNTSTFLLSALLLLNYGINGVAIAGILAQIVSLIVGSFFFVSNHRRKRSSA